MNAKDIVTEGATIAVSDLGRAVGDPDGLARLVASGVIVKDGKGRVPLVAGIQTYFTHLREQLRAGSATAAAERARLARAGAAELALAERKRELIATADAELAVDHLCAAIASAFGGLPARVTRDRTTRRMIEARVEQAQAATAEAIRSLDTGDGAPRRKRKSR